MLNSFHFTLCRYNGYWNHSDFIQDCCITDTTVLFLLDLWSLTVHGALWMLELNVRLNSFYPWIRLFDSRSLIVWYFSLLIAASQVSLFSVILYSRTFTSCRFILKKHAAVQRKFVSVCFLFLLFWGTPYTWTYAMLTCIVSLITLLYSWTSQTCVHDNVWLKT